MSHSERIAELMFRYTRNQLTVNEELELNKWVESSPENQKLFEERTDPENIRNDITAIYLSEESERIAELIFRYLRSELTRKEKQELNNWIEASPENQKFFQEETDPENIRKEITAMYASKDEIYQKILERHPEIAEKSRPPRKLQLISIAAAFLITMGISLFFLLRSNSKKEMAAERNEIVNKSIIPGGNHAVLTLASGLSIILDSSKSGIVSSEGPTTIIKTDSGQLVYSKNDQAATIGFGSDMLSTPRGGQYMLELSDGSKVWLNAASRIKYPISFGGSERKVEIEGEAYFEVEKITNPSTNKRVPFIVSINGKTDVEVLGTHFNVMAYHDEPFISTTLLEGSVKVGSTILIPGQQAQESSNGASVKVINDVDLNSIIAWKNGKTSFKDASIQEIMRAVSRWYDVDVEYKGTIPEKRFKGGLPRNTELSELLNVLEQNGIHFVVKGKKITVTP